MDRVLNYLCDTALGLSYDDLPGEVVDRATHIIVDTVGCALGGAKSPPARAAMAAAGAVAAGFPATVLVSGQKTSPDLAAFANGVMIRYLDYNDAYSGSITCHPSDLLAPVLAVAEARQASGRDVILGMVLGYEVFCGLIDFGSIQQEGEWDQSTYGVIGAAVAAGKLLGLKRGELANAISLATSSHLTVSQVRRGEISDWKGCAMANASRNAIFSASLAAKGMSGPEEVFEGKYGFTAATGIRFELKPLGRSAESFRIMRARLKPFPAGYHSQSAIEAVLELRPRISDTGAIREIRLETFPAAHQAMGSDESAWKPETRESADHSLPFVMACALAEGNLEIRHFDELYYKRPGVRALMEKIKVRIGAEPAAVWPEVPLNIVEVELKSGEILKAKVDYHLGHFKRLMTDEDQDRKFRPLAESLLSRRQTDRLLETMRNLDRIERIEDLISLTVARKARKAKGKVKKRET